MKLLLNSTAMGSSFYFAKTAAVWRSRKLRKLWGDVYTRLWAALSYADEANLELLRLGFPQEVAGLRAWRSGDLAQRLRATGLDI